MLWTYAISDLNKEEIVVMFNGKGLQKTKSKRIHNRKSN